MERKSKLFALSVVIGIVLVYIFTFYIFPVLYISGAFSPNATPNNEIQLYSSSLYRELKINKNKCITIDEKDTHGGFHGDGTYYITLDCAENHEEIEAVVNEWKRLPLTENLELIMYGGVKGGMTYGYNLANMANIPKVKNGYYFFLDRYSKATDRHNDIELFNRYSFNFSIAIYDSDNKMLYYLREDT